MSVHIILKNGYKLLSNHASFLGSHLLHRWNLHGVGLPTSLSDFLKIVKVRLYNAVRRWCEEVLVFMILGVSTVFLFGQVALPREETLCVVAQLGGPVTTWNLYSAQTTWGTEQILYIPAFLHDPGKGAWLTLFAEGYHFVDGKTIRIKIRNEAKWSDGAPITAQDFVYTFELTKKLGIGPRVGWNDYIECVKAVDNKVVEFRARADNLNYYQLLSYALGAKSVPKHVYEKLEA